MIEPASGKRHKGISLQTARNYLELCRVSNIPTVWTNVLTAVVLAGNGFSWTVFLSLSLSMSLFYAGGMCLNDICDITPDRIKKSSRPLVTGRISIRNAALFTCALFTAAMGLLAVMPFPRAFLAGIALFAVIVAYDMLHKATPLTVILMAGCRLMVFVVSSYAVTGRMVPSIALAALIHFLYVIILSIVARHENNRIRPFKLPIIPLMIAGVSLLDGMIMAVLAAPAWLFAGIAGFLLTGYGQKFIKGD